MLERLGLVIDNDGLFEAACALLLLPVCAVTGVGLVMLVGQLFKRRNHK